MNADSEQIALDKSLVVAPDQPLRGRKLWNCVIDALGPDKCQVIMPMPNCRIVEFSDQGKVIHLLLKACSYLGNPHPIYKKRVQLPRWYNEYVKAVREANPDIDVRYIGVYHYGDDVHGDNVIFIDFDKETYLEKKCHNSSAHVYTNDLFQAMTYGVFSKTDYFGNHITAIRRDKFYDYLCGQDRDNLTLFDLFREFNHGFTFGQWLKAVDIIKEMHINGWNQWRQTEWAGWFLEYKFNRFTIDSNVTDKMRYVGSEFKRDGDLDFDIRFEDEDFYGDLKASDVKKTETPGNDQHNLVECLFRHDKFWYIIYEHETIKDSEVYGYEATKGRNRYIKSVDPEYNKDEMSYHRRMKYAVRFVRMTIIELNRINFREALRDFNQGHQHDGKARKPKFNINKKVLENDNYVVFRYIHHQ